MIRSGKLRELFRLPAMIYDWELKTKRQCLHFKWILCCQCNLSKQNTHQYRGINFKKCVPHGEDRSHYLITILFPSFLSEFVGYFLLFYILLCTKIKSSWKETHVTKPDIQLILHFTFSCVYAEDINSRATHLRVCSPYWFGVKLPTITSKQLTKGLGFGGLLRNSKRAVW